MTIYFVDLPMKQSEIPCFCERLPEHILGAQPHLYYLARKWIDPTGELHLATWEAIDMSFGRYYALGARAV